MKKKLLVVTSIVFIVLVGTSRGTTVINFDDLSTNESFAGPYGTMYYDVIPSIYEGLQWLPSGESGWNVNDGRTYITAYGNTYSAVSANNFASNSGLSVTSVDDSTFDFVGAYFSTWAQNNAFVNFGGGYFSAQSVTATGYNGNTIVGTVTMNLSSTGFNWLAANFVGIDKVEFSTPGQGYWIMDNFTIPEPATVCLLALGGLLLRKRS